MLLIFSCLYSSMTLNNTNLLIEHPGLDFRFGQLSLSLPRLAAVCSGSETWVLVGLSARLFYYF